MKVLFDTNVVIDIWAKDPQFLLDSYSALDVCMLRNWEVCLAVTAIPDIEYLLKARCSANKDQAIQIMDALLKIFTVIDVAECDCKIAHENRFSDIEDGIIAHAALRNNVDVVVSRDRDFEKAPIPSMTPRAFTEAYCPSDIVYTEESI